MREDVSQVGGLQALRRAEDGSSSCHSSWASWRVVSSAWTASGARSQRPWDLARAPTGIPGARRRPCWATARRFGLDRRGAAARGLG
eukprot:1129329-Pyramimonas_sp.AAC.1